MLHNDSLKIHLNEETIKQLEHIAKVGSIFRDDIQFVIFVINFLADKLKGAGGSAPAAAETSTPKNFRITQYSFADPEADGFDMRVELSDPKKDLWSIRSGSYRLSNKMHWSPEPLPGNRTQYFIEIHSFAWPEAMKLAEEKAKLNRQKRGLTK